MSGQQLVGGVMMSTPFTSGDEFFADIAGMDDSERSIANSLMRCVARWGIGKTTIEDIAREAGISRATVYRHFPGGKSAMMAAAWALDMSEFFCVVRERIAASETLEDALVSGIHASALHFSEHPALTFMRRHEPAEFERLVAFDRMDLILSVSGTSMAPLLQRFIPDREAFDTALWVTRLVVSYLTEPADYLDMTSEADVRSLVRTFILPGIDVELTNSVASNGSVGDQDLINSNQDLINGDPQNLGDHNVHS